MGLVTRLDVEQNEEVVWEEAVGPLLASRDAAALLAVDDAELAELARDGRVIALEEHSGEMRYPAWQFANGRPLEALVAAHRELMRTGHVSEWTAASFCVSEHPELDGLSPRAWVAAGRDETLALVARPTLRASLSEPPAQRSWLSN
jgi:hypothetical protein